MACPLGKRPSIRRNRKGSPPRRCACPSSIPCTTAAPEARAASSPVTRGQKVARGPIQIHCRVAAIPRALPEVTPFRDDGGGDRRKLRPHEPREQSHRFRWRPGQGRIPACRKRARRILFDRSSTRRHNSGPRRAVQQAAFTVKNAFRRTQLGKTESHIQPGLRCFQDHFFVTDRSDQFFPGTVFRRRLGPDRRFRDPPPAEEKRRLAPAAFFFSGENRPGETFESAEFINALHAAPEGGAVPSGHLEGPSQLDRASISTISQRPQAACWGKRAGVSAAPHPRSPFRCAEYR